MKRLLLILAIACLPACETTTGGGITLGPISGICYRSADGKYAVCYNPATKGYSVSATVPGGFVRQMTYDSATKSWRATLPDGSVAVYDKNGLRFEAPLPVSK